MMKLTKSFFQEVQGQLKRICEMGQVMRQAVQMDDQHYCSVKERLAQLEVMHLHKQSTNKLTSSLCLSININL